jgi:hypothetical protein
LIHIKENEEYHPFLATQVPETHTLKTSCKFRTSETEIHKYSPSFTTPQYGDEIAELRKERSCKQVRQCKTLWLWLWQFYRLL